MGHVGSARIAPSNKELVETISLEEKKENGILCKIL